jgi:hypothetical protein
VTSNLGAWMAEIERRLDSIEEAMGNFEEHVDDENDLDSIVDDMKSRLDAIETQSEVDDLDQRLVLVENSIEKVDGLDTQKTNDTLDLVRGFSARIEMLENTCIKLVKLVEKFVEVEKNKRVL